MKDYEDLNMFECLWWPNIMRWFYLLYSIIVIVLSTGMIIEWALYPSPDPRTYTKPGSIGNYFYSQSKYIVYERVFASQCDSIRIGLISII
jgi:polyferredoxin